MADMNDIVSCRELSRPQRGFLTTLGLVSWLNGDMSVPLWTRSIVEALGDTGVLDASLRRYAETAIERCKHDEDSRDYCFVMVEMLTGKERKHKFIKEFAGMRAVSLRCICGATYKWPDVFHKHKETCPAAIKRAEQIVAFRERRQK